jgi:glycosyltransferase involved in cell wall biosynthesis
MGAFVTLPWHISVIIPARDEERLLPRCLHSVITAFDRLPPTVSYDMIIAVDSSTDRTLEIATAFIGQSGGFIVPTQVGIVGQARALATEAALLRHLGYHQRWWLANTDADCEVPADWLTKQLHFADNGIDAVAGVVDVDSFQEHDRYVAERFRSSYLVKPDGSHAHVHGANLGIRADAYLRAGGWRSLETAEDHDLWSRLGHIGCNCFSTDSVRVLTSGRRVGRAPCGFADALAAHNESAA